MGKTNPVGTFVTYFNAIFSYWMALIPGGALAILEVAKLQSPRLTDWLDSKLSPSLQTRIWTYVFIAGIFVATFLAFRDVNNKLIDLQVRVDRGEFATSHNVSSQKLDDIQDQLTKLQKRQWLPLDANQKMRLKNAISVLPSRPITVMYSGVESYELAISIDKVFEELNWPREYPADIALGNGSGVRLFPSKNDAIDVLNAIKDSTGLPIVLGLPRPTEKYISIYVSFPI